MAAKKRTNTVSTRKFLEELMGGPLTIGTYIHALRQNDGASLGEFAQKLGVTKSRLLDIEKGRRGVSIERAADWARRLGLSEHRFVTLALQAEVDAAGLKFKVVVRAA